MKVLRVRVLTDNVCTPRLENTCYCQEIDFPLAFFNASGPAPMSASGNARVAELFLRMTGLQCSIRDFFFDWATSTTPPVFGMGKY